MSKELNEAKQQAESNIKDYQAKIEGYTSHIWQWKGLLKVEQKRLEAINNAIKAFDKP